MIQVTRLNKSELWVNADLIQFIEETPDTVLTLTTDVKIIVTESATEIVQAVVDYRRRILRENPQVIDRSEREA